MNIAVDQTRIKTAFEFLKNINSFTLYLALGASAPRAFSGFAFDKNPHVGYLNSFRFALLGLYCRSEVFLRFSQIIHDYAGLDRHRHPTLAMMTLIGEVALVVFKCYKTLKGVAKLKERLTMLVPDINLEENYSKIFHTMRDLGKFMHHYLITLIQTEHNNAVLNVAQLTMTVSFLRTIAVEVGPLDTDDLAGSTAGLAAMRMTARIAFEGLCTPTKRKELLDWAVNWFKRQIELDYGRHQKGVVDPEAVGHAGIMYPQFNISFDC
jgi:hypothetical protein